MPRPAAKAIAPAPVRGLRAYLTVLRSPGVRVLSIGAAIASLPVGMLGLSLLLLVQRRYESLAAAGVVVAALGVGTCAGMIVQGRLIDLSGPRRVLQVSSSLRAATSIGFVLAAGRTPVLALTVLAFLVGVSEPQVSSALRAQWPTLLPRELLPAANAVSSILFELPVVSGPLLLTAVIAVFPVELAVLGAAGFAVVGAWMFALSVGADPTSTPSSPRVRGLLGPLTIPAVRRIVVVVSVPGAALGIVQITSAAAATAAGAGAGAGAGELTGLLYAALTAGSLVGTVLYGSRARPVGARWLLPVLLLGQAAALAAMAVASGVGVLAWCVLGFGLLSGPVAVRCFVDLERPASGSLTAAITVVIAAGLAGTSLGSAWAGWASDGYGRALPLLVGSAILLLLGALLPLLQRRAAKPVGHSGDA
ncbi:MAG TPA: MFS transporter [Pseudonocardia sp.]